MSGAGNIVLGAVSFGPARSLWEEQPSLRELYDQACAGLVRAECEVEELRAEVALLREERNILARAKAAVTEGAEPSCNDSAQVFRERPEPSPHLTDTPETEQKAYTTGVYRDAVVAANFARRLERERDHARVQFRAAEGLGMALVKTINELKTEKADLFVKLVNLQAGSRPATLEEIRESVREKYDPEYEFGGREHE